MTTHETRGIEGRVRKYAKELVNRSNKNKEQASLNDIITLKNNDKLKDKNTIE